MADQTQPELESSIEYVVFPTIYGLRSGTLRLSAGRLSFTRSKGKVVFDAPVGEFHSFGEASIGTGFHIWQGSRRHRFVFHNWRVGSYAGPGVIGEVADGVDDFHQGLADMTSARGEVDRWRKVLTPFIASAPPPGVTIRPPMSRGRYILAVAGFAFGATAVIVAAIVVVVLATS